MSEQPRRVWSRLDIANAYQRSVARGLLDAAAECRSWRLELVHPNRPVDPLHPPDGFVLFGQDEPPTYGRRRVPAVTVSAGPLPTHATRVVPDNVHVGSLAARHLLAARVQSLAFFGRLASTHAQVRLDGFQEEVRLANRTVDLVVDATRNTVAVASRWAEQLASLPRRLGVLVSDDNHAVTLVQALLAAGLRIPDDVAAVGVNDDDLLWRSTLSGSAERPPTCSIG